MKQGMLYICATPIGNLEDITLRVVRALRECDEVYAEDTRRTLRLLNHLDTQKPLRSCHEHNERQRAQEILAKVREGKTVCFASDAGMPGISDPGALLIRAAIDENIPFTVLPGPAAAPMALLLSGLPTERFAFEGFLPAGGKALKQRLAALKAEERTMIFYEAPHRLLKTLESLLSALGERDAAVLREMTKLHEEAVRGPLSGILAHFEANAPRGECAVVVSGACPEPIEPDTDEWRAALEGYMASGLTLSDAARKTAEEKNAPYRQVYRFALQNVVVRS